MKAEDDDFKDSQVVKQEKSSVKLGDTFDGKALPAGLIDSAAVS